MSDTIPPLRFSCDHRFSEHGLGEGSPPLSATGQSAPTSSLSRFQSTPVPVLVPSTYTSAHQRHGEHAHAQLLIHLVLLVCDTVALRACPCSLVCQDLRLVLLMCNMVALQACPWQPCTLEPGGSSTTSLGLAGGDMVICSAGMAELRSCLMENASRKQA